MSQAPLIDPRRFCRENRQMEGVLALSELTRLADLLTSQEGEVAWRLAAANGENGQLRLSLAAEGALPLRCQRCLETVETPLVLASLLELVAEDAEPTQKELEDDRLDYLPVGNTLDVAALVEDEILLALPLAPFHVACRLPEREEAATPLHPFAALATLKQGRSD